MQPLTTCVSSYFWRNRYNPSSNLNTVLTILILFWNNCAIINCHTILETSESQSFTNYKIIKFLGRSQHISAGNIRKVLVYHGLKSTMQFEHWFWKKKYFLPLIHFLGENSPYSSIKGRCQKYTEGGVQNYAAFIRKWVTPQFLFELKRQQKIQRGVIKSGL